MWRIPRASERAKDSVLEAAGESDSTFEPHPVQETLEAVRFAWSSILVLLLAWSLAVIREPSGEDAELHLVQSWVLPSWILCVLLALGTVVAQPLAVHPRIDRLLVVSVSSVPAAPPLVLALLFAVGALRGPNRGFSIDFSAPYAPWLLGTLLVLFVATNCLAAALIIRGRGSDPERRWTCLALAAGLAGFILVSAVQTSSFDIRSASIALGFSLVMAAWAILRILWPFRRTSQGGHHNEHPRRAARQNV